MVKIVIYLQRSIYFKNILFYSLQPSDPLEYSVIATKFSLKNTKDTFYKYIFNINLSHQT